MVQRLITVMVKINYHTFRTLFFSNLFCRPTVHIPRGKSASVDSSSSTPI